MFQMVINLIFEQFVFEYSIYLIKINSKFNLITYYNKKGEFLKFLA